jgi:hypothetical protein
MEYLLGLWGNRLSDLEKYLRHPGSARIEVSPTGIPLVAWRNQGKAFEMGAPITRKVVGNPNADAPSLPCAPRPRTMRPAEISTRPLSGGRALLGGASPPRPPHRSHMCGVSGKAVACSALTRLCGATSSPLRTPRPSPRRHTPRSLLQGSRGSLRRPRAGAAIPQAHPTIPTSQSNLSRGDTPLAIAHPPQPRDERQNQGQETNRQPQTERGGHPPSPSPPP